MKHDIHVEQIQKVQRIANKLMRGFNELVYKESLKRCTLTITNRIRNVEDVIESYKSITGKKGEQCKSHQKTETTYINYQRYQRNNKVEILLCKTCRPIWNDFEDASISVATIETLKQLGKMTY